MPAPAIVPLLLASLASAGASAVVSERQGKKARELQRLRMQQERKQFERDLASKTRQADIDRRRESEAFAEKLERDRELAMLGLEQEMGLAQAKMEQEKDVARQQQVSRVRELEAERATARTAASQAKETRKALAARALQRKNIKVRPSKGFSGVSGAVLDEGVS